MELDTEGAESSARLHAGEDHLTTVVDIVGATTAVGVACFAIIDGRSRAVGCHAGKDRWVWMGPCKNVAVGGLVRVQGRGTVGISAASKVPLYWRTSTRMMLHKGHTNSSDIGYFNMFDGVSYNECRLYLLNAY